MEMEEELKKSSAGMSSESLRRRKTPREDVEDDMLCKVSVERR